MDNIVLPLLLQCKMLFCRRYLPFWTFFNGFAYAKACRVIVALQALCLSFIPLEPMLVLSLPL